MVGSVREAADLVVTDPLQAGVMAVMAIADTARFDLDAAEGEELLRRVHWRLMIGDRVIHRAIGDWGIAGFVIGALGDWAH